VKWGAYRQKETPFLNINLVRLIFLRRTNRSNSSRWIMSSNLVFNRSAVTPRREKRDFRKKIEGKNRQLRFERRYGSLRGQLDIAASYFMPLPPLPHRSPPCPSLPPPVISFQFPLSFSYTRPAELNPPPFSFLTLWLRFPFSFSFPRYTVSLRDSSAREMGFF